MATPVIFRKWPKSEGGGVIALFPTEPGTLDPYTCSSYEHIGQHGAADPDGVIQRTKAATPAEYKDLKEELESIGYDDLQVRQRYQYAYLEERRNNLRGLNAPATIKRMATKPKRRKSNARPSGFGGVR